MGTSERVVIFPDTNIFLHFRPIAELDWQSLVGGKAVLIQVCPTVIRELDKHKTFHSVKRIRERAATATKMLYGLLQGALPSKVCGGVELDLSAIDPASDFAVSKHLNLQLADDSIVAAVLEYQESHPDAKIFLLTADLTLLVKARHNKIDTLQLPEDLRLPDEPTPEEQKIKELEKEVRLYKNRVPELVLAFDNGEEHKTFQIHGPGPAPIIEADIAAAMKAIKEKYPLTKPELPPPTSGEESAARLTEHLRVVLKDLTANMQGLPGDYDLRLEKWFGTYEQYLREAAEFLARQLRTIQVDLILMNAGTCPAEDVDINLHFPDGFTMYNEGEQPERPEEPAAPSYAPFNLGNLGLASIRAITPDMYAPTVPNPHRPKIRRSNSYDVTISCGGLKHDYIYRCDPIYLAFDSFEGANSFSFTYNLHAANAPVSAKGDLHIILEKNRTPPLTTPN